MILRLGALGCVGLLTAAFMPVSSFHSGGDLVRVQTESPPQAAPAQAPETVSPPEPPPPLTPEQQKAADERLAFDRLLVDASVLMTNLENYRRGRSKTPVSLSAFRSLEIRLNAVAEADPANTQAREMANAMKMAQFEILAPSVEAAASASRQLYVQAMSEKMAADGIEVAIEGRSDRVVRFASPHMTRDMGLQLSQSAKIFDQARRLEFSRVVFSNGRRSWTYDLARGRYR